MIVYLSGKYAIDSNTENNATANDACVKLWNAGLTVLRPDLNSTSFEKDKMGKHFTYLDGDLELLARCDAIIMLPGWEDSLSVGEQHKFAKEHGIPIYYYPETPQFSSTELKRPEQCKAFINTVMLMYRVHLSKNSDYSPGNILGTGEIGIITRTWDKVMRIMNLTGFKIEIASSTFEAPTTPKFETLNDTWMDLAVYSIIGIIYRLGVWGK